MDKFHSQSSGAHVKEGHEDSDLNIRAIVISGIVLVVCGVLSFVGVHFFARALERYEKSHDAVLTPMEQQLQKQRETLPVTADKTPEKPAPEGLKPPPDWYGRGQQEEHLRSTFSAPRLQYDDTRDMDVFRDSEEALLEDVGKDGQGNIHIPIQDAIDVLAKRGLPAVSGTFTAAQPQLPPPSSAQWQEVTSGAGQQRRISPAAGAGEGQSH